MLVHSIENRCEHGHGLTYHIVIVVDPDDEIEGGVSTIDNFVLPVIQKTTLVLSTA